MTEWVAVRGSTPAEEVEGLPDEATVWACWTTGGRTHTVTIYRGPVGYHVTHFAGDDVTVEESGVDEEAARVTAEGLRNVTGE